LRKKKEIEKKEQGFFFFFFFFFSRKILNMNKKSSINNNVRHWKERAALWWKPMNAKTLQHFASETQEKRAVRMEK